MMILNGKTLSFHWKPLADIAACLTLACASLTVLAAPGDQTLPLQASETNTIDRPAGSSFKYLSIAGSTFHPLDNTTTYTYAGNGCIAKSGGTSNLFTHKVVLPDDSVVSFIRLYYYDTSSSDVVAFFTTYDGAGNFSERGSASSMGGPGAFGSALSSDMGYRVAQTTDAINVVVNLGNQNDSTLRFCGVRIAYRTPSTDRIFAHGFDPNPL